MSQLLEQAVAGEGGQQRGSSFGQWALRARSPVDDCSPINVTGAVAVGRGLLSRPEQRAEQGLNPPSLPQVRAHPQVPGHWWREGSGVRQELDAGRGVSERGEGQERRLLSLKGGGGKGGL